MADDSILCMLSASSTLTVSSMGSGQRSPAPGAPRGREVHAAITSSCTADQGGCRPLTWGKH